MSGGPFPLPNAANYQNEPEAVNTALQFLEHRAIDAKKTVEELLYLLDLQEKAPWPDMLEKFSTLAGTMSQIQSALKKSAQPSSIEDHGALLRRNVLVPQRLQLEPDMQLQHITQNRIYSWNHDVVPNYLRTKPSPEIESEENNLDNERNSRGGDIVGKQISSINKHVDSFNVILPNVDKLPEPVEKATYSKDETEKLVRAIMRGDGLKMPMASQPPAARPPGPMMMQGGPNPSQVPMASMQPVQGRPMPMHPMQQGGMVPGMMRPQ